MSINVTDACQVALFAKMGRRGRRRRRRRGEATPPPRHHPHPHTLDVEKAPETTKTNTTNKSHLPSLWKQLGPPTPPLAAVSPASASPRARYDALRKNIQRTRPPEGRAGSRMIADALGKLLPSLGASRSAPSLRDTTAFDEEARLLFQKTGGMARRLAAAVDSSIATRRLQEGEAARDAARAAAAARAARAARAAADAARKQRETEGRESLPPRERVRLRLAELRSSEVERSLVEVRAEAFRRTRRERLRGLAAVAANARAGANSPEEMERRHRREHDEEDRHARRAAEARRVLDRHLDEERARELAALEAREAAARRRMRWHRRLAAERAHEAATPFAERRARDLLVQRRWLGLVALLAASRRVAAVAACATPPPLPPTETHARRVAPATSTARNTPATASSTRRLAARRGPLPTGDAAMLLFRYLRLATQLRQIRTGLTTVGLRAKVRLLQRWWRGHWRRRRAREELLAREWDRQETAYLERRARQKRAEHAAGVIAGGWRARTRRAASVLVQRTIAELEQDGGTAERRVAAGDRARLLAEVAGEARRVYARRCEAWEAAHAAWRERFAAASEVLEARRSLAAQAGEDEAVRELELALPEEPPRPCVRLLTCDEVSVSRVVEEEHARMMTRCVAEL